MKAWLIHHGGEPTPVDTSPMRTRRMGLLADALVDRGDNVVWWNSTYYHIAKSQRFDTDHSVRLSPRLRLNFIHAPPYRKNLSIGRLVNHRQLGRGLASWARREERPDVILCSLPLLEMGVAAVRYGLEHGVPVVLDVRDVWPDAILDMAPDWCRPLGRVALASYYRMCREACAGATAICGATDEFVRWGVERAARQPRSSDTVFPFGYNAPKVDDDSLKAAHRHWDSLGVGRAPDVPIICFFGLLNHQFDLRPALQAVTKLQQRHRVQFVVCGKGESAESYRREHRDNPDICFAGWVNGEQIWALMQRATFGLASYVDSPNFRMNLSNKAVEYLAGGLPILSSLTSGPLHRLVANEGCGLVYGGSAEQLYRELAEVLASPARLQEMSRNAKRVFASGFDAKRVYGDMARYLEDIAAASQAPYSSTAA